MMQFDSQVETILTFWNFGRHDHLDKSFIKEWFRRTTIIYQRVVLNYNATHIAATNGIGERAVTRWVERFDLFGTVLADAELFGETMGGPRVITYHDFQNSEIVKR